MLTKATLLNFLITVVIGSAMLALAMAYQDSLGELDEIFVFGVVGCVVSAVIGAPTLIIQLFYVNHRLTKDLPVRDRLKKQALIHVICGVVTFAILALIEFDWFWAVVLLLGYGLTAFVASSISNRKILSKHPLMDHTMGDVLDSSFDYI